jgi:hypothetical protein
VIYSERAKIAYAVPARRQRIYSLQPPDGKSFSTFLSIVSRQFHFASLAKSCFVHS